MVMTGYYEKLLTMMTMTIAFALLQSRMVEQRSRIGSLLIFDKRKKKKAK
jgi:hypothetical protein